MTEAGVAGVEGRASLPGPALPNGPPVPVEERPDVLVDSRLVGAVEAGELDRGPAPETRDFRADDDEPVLVMAVPPVADIVLTAGCLS